MSDALRFEPLRAVDLLEIEVREGQRLQYGMPVAEMTIAEAQSLADGAAWTAWDGQRLVACLGISETFEGAQGVAWALLGEGIGARHLQLTRFARDEVVGKSPLRRIEAIVRCNDADPRFTATRRILEAVRRPTPELRWTLALGFEPACLLRRFGAADEPHMLMERVN